MIIDIHCHLGDILYPGGGRLIWEKGVRKPRGMDLIGVSERSLHSNMGGLAPLLDRLFMDRVTRAERARNATATLENLRAAMAAAGVTRAVAMPIPPHVTFDDLARAADIDEAILPFTGVDFTRPRDLTAELEDHVARGARGLKLHPIIQQRPLDGPDMMAAVETFAPHGLPVLFHCGVSSYYLGEEKTSRQDPDLGQIEGAVCLASAFPGVSFIAGHAGLFEVNRVMDTLGPLANMSVDISFQSPTTIRKLIRVFGPERVLFASDWPYGNHLPAVRAVQKACGGDRGLERMIFCENAARLLKL
ncbi:MAG: amidohydrolase [Desulfobacterales bacterium]|nr:amidohydrolase [Desulfobacterales bacterium]